MSNLEDIDWSLASQQLASQGLVKVPMKLFDTDDTEMCCSRIDEICHSKDVEVNYFGTEHRIWNSQHLVDLSSKFAQVSDSVLGLLVNKKFECHNVLAIRNEPLTGKNIFESQGRWHIDSWRQQFKCFLFLRDVSFKSGPLQYLPKTHGLYFRGREMLGGQYTPTCRDIKNGTRKYSSLPDEWVNNLIAGRHYDVASLTTAAGGMFVVNTSGVHRAMPCEGGTRYALTAYYR
jgi:hypothetical protein